MLNDWLFIVESRKVLPFFISFFGNYWYNWYEDLDLTESVTKHHAINDNNFMTILNPRKIQNQLYIEMVKKNFELDF